jgi:hypothetical protein
VLNLTKQEDDDNDFVTRIKKISLNINKESFFPQSFKRDSKNILIKKILSISNHLEK